jgi:hypothetical protein
MEPDMPAQETIIGRAADDRPAAPHPEAASAAERLVLAQIEDRVPGMIARQRQRQTVLNREVRHHAAALPERS